uniref:Uncharacterized protein n=1 Tax=Leersia perrieri TaxID=77586 RepID=A0A0D9V1Q2_9ORYZ
MPSAGMTPRRSPLLSTSMRMWRTSKNSCWCCVEMLQLEEEHWRTGLVMRGDAARGSDNSRRRREQASGGGAVAIVDKAAGGIGLRH